MRPETSLVPLALLLIGFAAVSPAIYGVSWSKSDTRLTTNLDFDGLPSIMEAKDGKIWMVWTRGIKSDYNIYCKYSSNGGASWSSESAMTSDPHIDTGPSIYQTVNGTVWLVWSSSRSGSYDLYFKTSLDGGLSWSNDTRLTFDPADDLSPSICETLDGTVWLVWSSSRSGGYDLYFKTSSDGGLSWSNDTRLTFDLMLDKLPSIVQTDDGKIWVAFCSDRTGNYEIFYRVYNGSSWSNEVQLTFDSDEDIDPSILQTSDHKMWVFWTSCAPPDPATSDIYYKRSLDYGASWSASIQFTTDPGEDMWPAIAQSSDYKMWVVWTSDRADQPDWGNWDVYFRTSLVGDVNEDGIVSIMDLATVAKSYMAKKGDPNYYIDRDLNGDGLIDIRDLLIIGRNYGSTT